MKPWRRRDRFYRRAAMYAVAMVMAGAIATVTIALSGNPWTDFAAVAIHAAVQIALMLVGTHDVMRHG